MLKTFEEKYVVITKKNVQLVESANTKEDGNATVQTTNSAATAHAVSVKTGGGGGGGGGVGPPQRGRFKIKKC
jgi:uncharacterized membrane protein